MVLKHPQQLGDFKQVIGGGLGPVDEEFQELIMFVGSSIPTMRRHELKCLPTSLGAFMTIPADKLVRAEMGGHQGVGRHSQHAQEGPHTS
jgi:hypothetical protein